MITLYAFGPAFGLPDPSPFVIKTAIHLQMAGLTYRTDLSGFPVAPKGKLPYISDDGQIVPDSTFIRAHIERKYGMDLDEGLTARQRVEAWAIERMCEDHLTWIAGWFRWEVEENFRKGPLHFFDKAPGMCRARFIEEARTKVKQAQWSHGIGRHSLAEIADLGSRSLAALAVLLGDKPYMMSDRPTGVDGMAAGVLAEVLTPYFDTPLRREAESFPNLVAYTDRMLQRYFQQNLAGEPVSVPVAMEVAGARSASARTVLA
ncbi:MAG TPA: glutathione S-transferase family protein [Alphaproteobacteria bacterium]|nr:glutathione S-transferase family protein [Alphaproteobacteria bacterium]